MTVSEIYVSTDIETNGWNPGENSMLSLASAAFLADKTLLGTFTVNLEPLPDTRPEPITMQWWHTQPEAFAALQKNRVSAEIGMRDYCAWLKKLPGKIIFVGFPVVFDFPFVNYYLQRFTGENPFGFASIDVRSYGMGLQNLTYRKANRHNFPKDWFDNRPHTHIALDDALEQGALFCNMLIANNKKI